MSKPGGFITLHRQIMDWEWYGDPCTFNLFIHLLLMASYEENRFEGRVIQRGQVVTSLTNLAKETGQTIRQTRTALSHLISTGEVTNESTTQYRVISIVNYDKYQTIDKASDKQSTNDRQTNRQTNRQHYNNINNINKVTNNNNCDTERQHQRFSPPTVEEVREYCKEIGSDVDPERFVDYYSQSGWVLKSGTKMKDWKATIRNWTRRDKDGGHREHSGDAQGEVRTGKYDFLKRREEGFM